MTSQFMTSQSKKNDVSTEKIFGFSTRAIHAGQCPAPGNNAVITPIYQTSTYAQASPGVYEGRFDYSRTANPTRSALEANLASLEGAKHGICFASGCAAADAVLHLFQSGDHIICGDDVYGGTFRIFDAIFKRLGLSFTFVDLCNPQAIEKALTPNTKLIWLESPTNPLLKVVDIEQISLIAKRHQLKVIVDNTFASPYLQNPLALGADIVLHSSTKYIGGHCDVIGGALFTNDSELGQQLLYIQNAVGAVPGPFDCFLLLRSTKTLSVRMRTHCENALKIAHFLEARNDIEKIIYPGLKSHPQHELAGKQMRAGGGMITVVLKGGLTRAKSFLENVTLFTLAESLGGVESLIEHPAIMTHASIPLQIRESLGITDGLVRLSVGIEDVDDLISDLKDALAKSSQ